MNMGVLWKKTNPFKIVERKKHSYASTCTDELMDITKDPQFDIEEIPIPVSTTHATLEENTNSPYGDSPVNYTSDTDSIHSFVDNSPIIITPEFINQGDDCPALTPFRLQFSNLDEIFNYMQVLQNQNSFLQENNSSQKLEIEQLKKENQALISTLHSIYSYTGNAIRELTACDLSNVTIKGVENIIKNLEITFTIKRLGTKDLFLLSTRSTLNIGDCITVDVKNCSNQNINVNSGFLNFGLSNTKLKKNASFCRTFEITQECLKNCNHTYSIYFFLEYVVLASHVSGWLEPFTRILPIKISKSKTLVEKFFDFINWK